MTVHRQRSNATGAPKAQGRVLLRWLIATPALLMCAAACLVDSDDRCGQNQVLQDDLCMCAEGFGRADGQCVACGPNETGTPDGCECNDGFVRATEDSPCESDDSLGKACTTDTDCDHAVYSSCQSDGSDGYCTNTGCATSADCVGDYACNTYSGGAAFCERPPSGLGEACSSDADCAGSDASFCEIALSQSCLVNDCASDPNVCHGDWVCCDIALLSESLCIPPDELSDGSCPAGGTLIPRGGNG